MLEIKKQIYLEDFETWGGAKDTMNYLTRDEIATLESHLIEMYPNGMLGIELNDFLSFETDLIAELLGYNDFDEIIERK